ncbi:MAG: RagB/SusD family nutrient uptake outer membrane protein [Gracilimonas sp.]|uniref:RagB/SusD family nutrient uptake outer membrane protein n=1 Tax=Gracilimonas sp. TaxID=1974203 RepID=UPI0037500C72|nr:RagB/SusD family nutrient uptake outer membrane protein [Gracilimonas sp.]
MLINQQKGIFLVTLFALLFGSCNLVEDVPDYNNPSLEELTNSPTRVSVNTLATGLLIGSREGIENYLYMTGIIGREMYDLDASTLATSELIIGPLDPGQWGGNGWVSQYQNLRNAKILLSALDQVEDMSEAEKEGIRGYAKTMQAYDLLLVINTRDINGAVIEIADNPTAEPGPIIGKELVLAQIEDWLDEAMTHLQSAGNSFSFNLSSGFENFDTPPTFLEFNRALQARVNTYQEDYPGVLSALDDSFLDLNSSLDLGVYHTHSSSAGDLSNFFSTKTQGDAPDYVAQADFETDVQNKIDGEPDDRYQQKFRKLPSVKSHLGLTSDISFIQYSTPSSSIPIIRNEELILLRAEANYNLENYTDAADDINFIREESGGLEQRNDLDANNMLDELLYNKRYSLYMEGGHRWLDLRRYDLLNRIPLDIPDAVVHERFPIPLDECLSRGLPANCSDN